ncbi:MAG: PHP domain-containing protein, partial [Lentisphaeria bacterium]
KLCVRLAGGLQVDFRYFEKAAFGAALLYFTGSRAHNVAVRKIAVEKDLKLNEYGLYKGDDLIAGKNEEGIYKELGLSWIPPELREDNGEIEVAQKDTIPELVQLNQIRGDLHCHSTATDGKNTITEMAEAARERGYQYLAICDHSQAVRIAGGLNEEQLQEHAGKIRETDAKYDDFWLLAGVEVDIMKDGSLDLDEQILADLDWVTASIHYNFNLSSEQMTERLLSAIRSGVVHSLGHPFGRQFGRRDPMQFNVDKVFKACSENNVCLEINAQPERLDLLDVYCRKAKDAGVKIVINTDAHTTDDLDFMEFGVGIARRGWLEKSDIANSMTAKQLGNYLGKQNQ